MAGRHYQQPLEVMLKFLNTPKNRIIFVYQVILFFLLNFGLLFCLDILLKQIPFFLAPRLFEIFLLLIFGGSLFVVNRFLLIPLLKKTFKNLVKKKKLVTTKKHRKSNKYIYLVLLLTGLFFYQSWNIGLIVREYTSPLTLLLNWEKTTRDVLAEIDYSGLNSNPVDAGKIRTTSPGSDYGRFLRTWRWQPFIEKAEKAYNIEKGLLAGLIMQESYGNPLQLNSGNDGGAGLMMFQPGTAKEYGLKTYGNSSATGKDKVHGLQLQGLVKLHQYNYQKLSEIDERFHVAKSIDAGARFLSVLHTRYKSWDKAISAYNRGKPAALPKSTTHVRRVRYFQREYLRWERR